MNQEIEIVRARVTVWTREIERLQKNVALGLKWLTGREQAESMKIVRNPYKPKEPHRKNQ